MGDRHRGDVFTAFLLKNFPHAQRILCVADGNLVTAHPLAATGRDVLVVDPWMRAGKGIRGIMCRKERFTATYRLPSPVDLVVGMHPDEATGEALLYALHHKLPFALCPCCIKGVLSDGVTSKRGWLTRLAAVATRQHFHVAHALLAMKGDNIMLLGKPGKRS